MSLYLLDTTPLTAFFLGRAAAITLVQPWLNRHEATTSILVYGEIVEYLMTFPHFHERKIELRRVLHAIPPLLVSYSTLDRYAALRRMLRPPQGPGLIGDIDVLIAATALERDLTIVTTDRDFARVPNLSLLLLDRQSLTPIGDARV